MGISVQPEMSEFLRQVLEQTKNTFGHVWRIFLVFSTKGKFQWACRLDGLTSKGSRLPINRSEPLAAPDLTQVALFLAVRHCVG